MKFELQLVGLETLQSFRTLYEQQWPKYCEEYYCLDNFIGFWRSNPNIENLKAYTLSDQRAKKAALFMIVDRYQLFVGSLNNSSELLKQALNLLDWSTGLKCSSIPARHITALTSIVEEKELKVLSNNVTNLYYMPQKEASVLEIEIPNGYHMKSLSVSDADLINEEWSNRHVGSLYFIQRQIRMCPSVGLYATNSQELVAWCIRLQGGFLGALQVKSSHQRRGFGGLVTKEISKRIAALGQDVMALVEPQNQSSSAMFVKLGFKMIDQCYWLRTEPIQGGFLWPDGQ